MPAPVTDASGGLLLAASAGTLGIQALPKPAASFDPQRESGRRDQDLAGPPFGDTSGETTFTFVR
jgi:hypothetical protein